MVHPTDLRDLPSHDWQRLQDLADRFEQAWRNADQVDLAPFLPPPDDPLRTVALQELIKSDLEIRWRRFQGVTIERYLEQFPELASAGRLIPHLLYEEYRVRQLYGDRPAVTAYQVRFPGEYEALQRLLVEQPLPTQASLPRTPGPEPEKKPSRPTPLQAPAEMKAAAGGQVLMGGENYKLERRLGSGGFGEVWLAENRAGFPVAVKILFRPLGHEEVRRELEVLGLIKRLHHPYLLQTLDYWVHQDRLHIAMELAGGSLRDRHKECRQQGLPSIPAAELLAYFREAAEALDYLHGKGVLHRDVKPDNILLLERHAKVADFGLMRKGPAELASMSSAGTPVYMAPEVWRGKASPHSDQYSLAYAYAELRLDRRPFPAHEVCELIAQHLEQTPDLAPLPEAERRVLLRALAKDPDQRYPNCLAFAQALQEAVGASPWQASAAPAAPPPVPPRSEATPAVNYRSVSDTAVGVGPSAAAPAGQGDWRRSPARPAPGRGWLVPAVAAVAVAAATGGGLYWWISQRGKGQPPASGRADTPPAREPDTSRARPPEVYLPPGCESAAGARLVPDRTGRQYHDRIDRVLGDQTRVRFVLVPQVKATDPATFYVMEDKVWNDLYARFAAARPEAVKKSEWQKGGRKGGEDAGAGDKELPVLRVTAEEARECAAWLGGLLPTARQWDLAAGSDRREGREEGPYQGRWKKDSGLDIAVNRWKDGPRPVTQTTQDVSPLHVRGLAGNGREWTRTLLGGGEMPARPAPDDLVVLRGRLYTLPTPLTYADLDYERETPQRQEYGKASPYTGFRVVIETKP